MRRATFVARLFVLHCTPPASLVMRSALAPFRSRSYRFQRNIEARIRLMDATGRHELPDNDRELAKLAYLLGHRPHELVDEAQYYFAENRNRFNRIFDEAERS